MRHSAVVLLSLLAALCATDARATVVLPDTAAEPLAALSARDLIAEQQLRAVRAARGADGIEQIAQWRIEDLCAHLRAANATWLLQLPDEQAETKLLLNAFWHDTRAGASACRGELTFANADLPAAIDLFGQEPTLAPDAQVRLAWSWARWYAGEHAAALKEAAAYIRAARASGKLAGTDLAMARSLYLLAGKAAPANFASTEAADGPWPAPLLAWQRGALDESALFKAIAGYAPAARALALNDAWFHVGVRRRAQHDLAGATTAFRWYLVDGLRATLPCILAGLAQPVVTSADPDFVAGRDLIERGDVPAALAAWRKAAQKGIVDAQAWLGATYATGQLVPRDVAAARQWLVPAAQAGSSLALTQLAGIEMVEVHGDRALGIAQLERAVALYDGDAMLYLSSLYHIGAVPTPSPGREAELERQAAEMDVRAAQSKRAFRYLNGIQVTPNDAMARYWAQRAIVSGSDDGYAVLARLLLRGGPADQRAALDMVRNLAVAGNGPALRVMGFAAMRGIGQPVDLAAGRAW